jgi:ribulose kinase
MGELTPHANPMLRGSFIGVSAGHTKAHFARAVMEGVAMSLLDCITYLKEKGVKAGDSAYIIGGGAKSKVWRQIVADALNLTLVQTENNDSSFGSAMCAGISAGFFADFDEAFACRATGEPEGFASGKHRRIRKQDWQVRKFGGIPFREQADQVVVSAVLACGNFRHEACLLFPETILLEQGIPFFPRAVQMSTKNGLCRMSERYSLALPAVFLFYPFSEMD